MVTLGENAATVGDLRLALEKVPDSTLLNIGNRENGFSVDKIQFDGMSVALETNKEAAFAPISEDKIAAAKQCLVDNGIEPDEVENVLQALGYILLSAELFPEAPMRENSPAKDAGEGAAEVYKGFRIFEKDGVYTIGQKWNDSFDDCSLENLGCGVDEFEMVQHCREHGISLEFYNLRDCGDALSYEKYLEHLDKYHYDHEESFLETEFVVPFVSFSSVDQVKEFVDWIEERVAEIAVARHNAEQRLDGVSPMDKDRFWYIIASVNSEVDRNDKNAVLRLTEEKLYQLPSAEIAQWYAIYDAVHNEADKKELWDACSKCGAHYTDDGFCYFRAWLISQGQEVYDVVLSDPAAVSLYIDDPAAAEFEGYGYVSWRAYAEKACIENCGEEELNGIRTQWLSENREHVEALVQTSGFSFEEIRDRLFGYYLQEDYNILDAYDVLRKDSLRDKIQFASSCPENDAVVSRAMDENYLHERS